MPMIHRPSHLLSALSCLTLILLSCGGGSTPNDGGTVTPVQQQGLSSIGGVVSSPGAGTANTGTANTGTASAGIGNAPGSFRAGTSWWTDNAAVALRQAAAGAVKNGAVPGEYIVRLRGGLGVQGLPNQGLPNQSLPSLSVAGAQLRLVSQLGLPGLGLYRVQGGTLGVQSLPEASVLSALAARPDVLYAEPNRWLHALKTPNDKGFQYQWGAQAMNLPAAWDISTGGAITVAVVDTGIVAHPDLAGKILPGYDFVSDKTDAGDGDGPDADPTDMGGSSDYHGTHVAGIIGAVSNNGVGIAGVSWGAKILPVRVLGTSGGGTLADILTGVQWAVGAAVPGAPNNPNPAKVVNLSLGGAGACSQAEQDVFDQLAAAGVVTVVAAGNDSADASTSSPANCQKVITVGASGPDGKRAYYSNHGARIDVMAPGGDTTVLLKVGTQQIPGGILSTVKNDSTTPPSYDYALYEGTSQATPQVAGVAALLLSTQPSLTPRQVLDRIKAAAHPLSDADCGFKAGCGAGIIDAAATLRGGGVPTPAPTPAPAPVARIQTLVAAAYVIDKDINHIDIDKSLVLLLDQKVLRNPYKFQSVPAGNYLLLAWQDVNNDKKLTEGEPFGVFPEFVDVDNVSRTLVNKNIDLTPYTASTTASVVNLKMSSAALVKALELLSHRK